MVRRFPALHPVFGRPIGPGDAAFVPSTYELQIHSVAANAPVLAVSGFVICIAVVAAFWTTAPSMLLLGWAGITCVAMACVPWLLSGIGERVLEDAEAKATRSGDVVLSVSDTGIGMKPEEIVVALTPFGQVGPNMAARAEGTGLGLPLCQRFAEALGGALAIESARGKGTKVTVTLPARCALPRTGETVPQALSA